MDFSNTKYSVLDLARYSDNISISQAFKNSVILAKLAETWGYHRFWLAEHHSLEGVASAATSILINHVAANTESIRVGSGGIMLPNHPPLIIAEQFATLEALHPGRIDLGLGRAPGSDQHTMRALRRHNLDIDFGDLIEELEYYFSSESADQKLKAIPGVNNSHIPLWILGSSLYSAHLAARLGRPYSFAGHFAPRLMLPALEIYRTEFQPSAYLSKPHVMVGVPIIAAETHSHAEFIATSIHQTYLGLIRNQLKPAQPPVKNMNAIWTEQEKRIIESNFGTLITGDLKGVQEGLYEYLMKTQADEIIVMSDPYDFNDRLKSFEIIAQAVKGLKYGLI